MVNLTKKFENLVAVNHPNLEIENGEILGLLGPNGAGKTTTLLMLTTVIKPTEGTAFIGPYDVTREPDKTRTLIGMAFQEPKLLWVSTPWDVLNWHAKVCGLSTDERKKRVRWILEELGLWNERRKTVHTFSGGMRKRVETAKILIQRPKIAIIDEPTTQIDIVGKHKIWNMIRTLRDEGSTILLATNELYEADMLSDRVAIMHEGKLLICDNPKKNGRQHTRLRHNRSTPREGHARKVFGRSEEARASLRTCDAIGLGYFCINFCLTGYVFLHENSSKVGFSSLFEVKIYECEPLIFLSLRLNKLIRRLNLWMELRLSLNRKGSF